MIGHWYTQSKWIWNTSHLRPSERRSIIVYLQWINKSTKQTGAVIRSKNKEKWLRGSSQNPTNQYQCPRIMQSPFIFTQKLERRKRQNDALIISLAKWLDSSIIIRMYQNLFRVTLFELKDKAKVLFVLLKRDGFIVT